VSTDLREPVFQQDIDTEHEYAMQGWKTYYTFFERLRAQGAPSDLLDKVAEITATYKDLTDQMASIQQCFPVEKRR